MAISTNLRALVAVGICVLMAIGTSGCRKKKKDRIEDALDDLDDYNDNNNYNYSDTDSDTDSDSDSDTDMDSDMDTDMDTDMDSDMDTDTDSDSDTDSDGDTSGGVPVSLNTTTPTVSIPTAVLCEGDSRGDEGTLTAVNTPVFSEDAHIDSLQLQYTLDSFIGEPTQKGAVAWQGEGSLYEVFWVAEVQDPHSGSQYVTSGGERIYASYLLGTYPDPGGEFGWDMTGSPSWSETFVTYNASTNEVEYGVSEGEAQAIYDGCFRLQNLTILGINDGPAFNP